MDGASVNTKFRFLTTAKNLAKKDFSFLVNVIVLRDLEVLKLSYSFGCSSVQTQRNKFGGCYRWIKLKLVNRQKCNFYEFCTRIIQILLECKITVQ